MADGCAECGSPEGHNATCSWSIHERNNEIESLLTQLSQAAARVAVVEKALKPFAAFAAHVAKEHPGWDHDTFAINTTMTCLPTMKAFRDARAALSPSSSDGVLVPRERLQRWLTDADDMGDAVFAAELRALLSDGR